MKILILPLTATLTCRSLKPQFIGKAKIATQVFGELMNGFVEPLGLKAMV
jgi:hypothetical protein